MIRWSKIPRTLQFAARLSFIGLVTMLTVIMVLPFSDVSFARPPAQGPDEEPAFQASSYAAADGSSVIHSQETTLKAAYFEGHGTAENLEITPDGLKLAAGATTGTYTSDPLASPMGVTTDLVPSWRATLPPGAGVKLETRLSSDGATWTGWAENPVAFYPVRDNEHGGTLVWIGSRGPVFAQVRLTLSAPSAEASPTLHYLSLVFSDASQGPSDAAIAAQMPFEAAAEICPPDRPPVATRTQWGCPDKQRSPYWRPQATDVTHIVVHHSATPSTFEEWNQRSPYYQISEWSAVVRAIWNYHANTLRWGDVGYNYIIDPEGQIYEGRAGSREGQRDIVGAHDGNNRHSMGVGFIGCYGNCGYLGLQNADPPHTMMNKGVELIAWKVGQKGLDPHGQTPYHGRLTPVIAGGRDVTATYSPGDNLYNWLPWVRDAVWERVTCPEKEPCQITDIIFDKDAYEVNETIHITAKVTDPNGAPLAGATVKAEVSVESFASAVANSNFELDEVVGEYRGTYPNTGTPGTYNFTVTAEHPNFQTCSLSESVEVGDHDEQECTVTARAEPSTLAPGEPVDLIADVTLDGQDVTNAEVIAHISRPNSSFEELPLPWRSGSTYRETYPNTDVAGQYTFFITARGEVFEECRSEDYYFNVEEDPPSVTVSIQPSSIQIPLCVTNKKTELRVTNLADLHGFSFKLHFDPDVVRVVDADPNTAGVQILLGGPFRTKPHYVAINNVDQASGLIDFGVVLLAGESFSGDGVMAEINWAPHQVGSTDLTLSQVGLVGPSGTEIAAQVRDGFAEVTDECTAVSGQVYLQGRTNHGGVTVANRQGQQVQTDLDGAFSIASSDSISVKCPGYLSAQADVPTLLAQRNAEAADASSASLGSITLLAGDINSDDVVNIFDLAYMASNYQATDPLADLNTDGIVNILDLALAANNYLQQGPLTDWQ